MKILITGTSGHLGEAIARLLKSNNEDYIGLDINPSAFTTHVGSITDKELVSSLVKKVDFIIHTATLHKPHVGTHSNQDFVDTNITGTLTLLEEAREQNIKGFIYTSTTSTFGDMLTPKPGEPAIWITEKTIDIPKNIYGVTKNAAEDLCQLFYRNHKLPCLVLKTSRFFPEEDDKKAVRDKYDDLNIKAIEYLYRRVDIEDVVTAHLLAVDKVQEIGFGKYIISATSPFEQHHLMDLHTNANAVVEKLFPEFKDIFKRKGWKMLPQIDRVYVNAKARQELGWKPKYDFGYILNCIAADKDFRSQLSLDIGIKGYHEETFTEGPYPVLDI
ncbi:NAD-dependent epimerase/dehydratase family protein [Chitinophaga qingshengii]|uniref:NAD(P)-dependent oxidoreductase n=1 Tax=Chitinophaga qingshengii TaxID=1569794 RepID=A0ABR7TX48_9BACT|nr:NAD(P)-dependent oxidoreductase [Chitinophaga qingshengii]MBC9934212.1 NAD(P)-dependent oxidoreductase [Chitinophaga qingshengii]